MSVLIKGVEMPNRCAECILCDLRYGTKCKVTGETYYDGKGYARGGYDGKPDWCPLIELPEKYGRLIDADALLLDFELAQKSADMHGREYANSFRSPGGELSTEWWAVEDLVENANTVIDAESE